MLILFSLALAVTPTGAGAEDVYVTNQGAGTVSVISTRTNRVIGPPIRVGKEPTGVAITPDGSAAYVANTQSETVSVIETATRRIVDSIPVGINPKQVAITPDGRTAYVTHEYSRDISAIDIQTGAVSPIPLGSSSSSIAITPDGHTAYIARFLGVSALDLATNSIVASFEAGFTPESVSVSPDGSRAYFTYYSHERNWAAVGVIDMTTNQLLAPLLPAAYSYDIAIGADNRTAYLTHKGPQGTVSALDLQTGQAIGSPVAVAREPAAIAISSDGARAYVVNHGSSTVSVLDLTDLHLAGSAIPVGLGPIGLAIDPHGASAYPRVRVRCPGSAQHRCVFRLQAIRGGRPATAVAWARLGPGRAALVALRPRRDSWATLATASSVLVREALMIGRHRHMYLRRLRIVRSMG
jgi:YVTN family beta-propeller protein